MDSQCDQVELHSRSRLKIRRAPSCKISAISTSSSFYRSCRQKKNNTVRQPLIFHTIDPEIIKTEPAEFMWLVQKLTGSRSTRSSLHTRSMQGSEEMQSSLDVQLMQQSNDDSLKEGTITIITPTASFINTNVKYHPPELPLSSYANQLTCKINQDLPSPLSPASSDVSNNTCSHPLASLLSSDTNQLYPKTNHPSSSFSSSSYAVSASTPMELPLSAKSSNNELCSDLPVSPKSSKCGGTNQLAEFMTNTRGPPCSPVSPNSSLTTSSAGYYTDNLSMEAGVSPYRDQAFCYGQGNTSEAEEDGSIDFFDFSLDSYYGNYNAAQDELEFHHSNVWDSFYQ